MVGTAQLRLCPPYGFEFQTAQQRHCERKRLVRRSSMSEGGSNPALFFAMKGRKLDCFVAGAPRNDVEIQFRIPAARCVRVLLKRLPHETRGRRECRARNAPAASRVIKNKTHEHSHHGHTGITRHPRAMVYGLLRALPGEPRSVATVISGLSPPT